MRKVLAELAKSGYEYRAGLEVEFYITRLEDRKLRCSEAGWPPDPPGVSVISHGYQYLTENHNDEIDEVLQALRAALTGTQLPLRSMEDEWGPGNASSLSTCRAALSQQTRWSLQDCNEGRFAIGSATTLTFMCWPGLPNFFPSGWHLHQSLGEIGGSRTYSLWTAQNPSPR